MSTARANARKGRVNMSRALQSMTGFGQAAGDVSERLSAEVRLASVNARFLEVTLRVFPRIEATELEAAVRTVLAQGVTRGKVIVTMDLTWRSRQAAALQLNWDVAALLQAELERRPAGLELAPLTLRDLLSLPGFVEGGRELSLEEAEQEALLGIVAKAREALVQRRESEAEALMPQVRALLGELEAFHRWLETVNASVGEALLARLSERIRNAVGELVPEDRLIQEAAVLADRADVSEEVQRLGAHLAHLRSLLDGGGAVGKKLDFLLQELLREVNTSGSKCRETGMGERVVAAKAALEKLREQCANLE